MSDKKQIKVAYTIQKKGEKSFWNRVGYGSVNKDGSINLKLFAMPINGELNIRDQKNSVPETEPANA